MTGEVIAADERIEEQGLAGGFHGEAGVSVVGQFHGWENGGEWGD
jgi:hypothetical protein